MSSSNAARGFDVHKDTVVVCVRMPDSAGVVERGVPPSDHDRGPLGYERRNGVPSARQLSDADLLEQIRAIHTESKGTYGAPRIHKQLLHRHVACGKRKVTRLDASGRPRGPVQEALAQDHRG